MTTFNLNNFLADDDNLLPDTLAKIREEQAKGIWGLPIRRMKSITCADGLEFSAQASELHYCSPRKNLGPYTAIEIGFPTQKVDEFMPYAEDENVPTGTVYGWVPVEIVEQVVMNHGGLAPKTPELIRYDSPDQIFG